MLLLGNAPLPLHRTLVRAGYQLAYGRSPLARRAAELERSQWWSPEQHREAQWLRLTRLIEHAYRTVPFYREAMQGLGMEPGDIRSVRGLRPAAGALQSYYQPGTGAADLLGLPEGAAYPHGQRRLNGPARKPLP